MCGSVQMNHRANVYVLFGNIYPSDQNVDRLDSQLSATELFTICLHFSCLIKILHSQALQMYSPRVNVCVVLFVNLCISARGNVWT